MRVSVLHVSLFALVVCIGAAAVQPLEDAAPGGTSIAQQLQRRQIGIGPVSSAPSQCSSSCSPVNDEINLGCPPTACCTTTFETQYYNCLECVGAALDAGNYSTVQTSLNLLYMTCVDLGFVLPRMELPGQSASNSDTGAQPTSTGSSSTSPLTSTGATSSGAHATGAAVSGKWHGLQAEALIGASVLLWVATLW